MASAHRAVTRLAIVLQRCSSTRLSRSCSDCGGDHSDKDQLGGNFIGVKLPPTDLGERLIEMQYASGLQFGGEDPAAAIGLGLDDRADMLTLVGGRKRLAERGARVL